MPQPEWFSRLRQSINQGAGRWAAMAVAAALLGGAVWLTLSGRGDGGRTEAIRERGHTVYYVCKACGDTGRTHKAFEQAFPIACPKCGAVQAVEGFPCLGCKRIIPQRPREVTVFHCPHADCRFKYNRRAVGG